MQDVDLSAAVQAIEQRLAVCTVPGLAVGITDRQSVRSVIFHGFADLKRRTPLTIESRFAIGSVSKSFTAVALMQLTMEGRLDPHAPLTQYLPSLSIRSPFAAMTTHHVLTHTAGLPNYMTHAASSRYVIAALEDFTPSYAPGAHYWYSNTGYQLLGYVLETIEQNSYPAILQRRIFDPLGMHSSAGAMDDAERARTVTSYMRWSYDGAFVEAPWFEYTAADGSLISTISDLCTYARFLLNRGNAGNERLLSEEAYTALTTPILDDYAYGLFVQNEDGHAIFSHGGEIGGYGCAMVVHPDHGFGLAVMCNGPMEVGLRKWMTDVVSAAFRGKTLPASLSRTEVGKIDIGNYAGMYHLAPVQAEGEKLEFTASDGRLWLERGRGRVPLQCMRPDCFRVIGADSDGLPFLFWRASEEANAPIVEVSHGARWYVTEAFTGRVEPEAPQEYSAYVGHFENNGPEGPVARIFVRNGRLWAIVSPVFDLTAVEFEPLGQGLFRYGVAHNPERVRFDTVLEGVAQRMTFTGVPMYRIDTP
jgi:D-alanyl-D-alanine carboxypeptidase